MSGGQHLLLLCLAALVASNIAHKPPPPTAKPPLIVTPVTPKPARDDLLDFLAEMGDTGGVYPGFGGFGSVGRPPNRGFGYGGRRFGPAYQGPGYQFNTGGRRPVFGGRPGFRGGSGGERNNNPRSRGGSPGFGPRRSDNSGRRRRDYDRTDRRRRRRDDSYVGRDRSRGMPDNRQDSSRGRDGGFGSRDSRAGGGRFPAFPSVFNFGNRRRSDRGDDRGMGGRRFPVFNFGGFGGNRGGDRDGDNGGGRRFPSFPSFNFGNRFPFFGTRRDRDRDGDGGFGGGRRDQGRDDRRRGGFNPFAGWNPFAGFPRGRDRDDDNRRDRPSFRPLFPRRDDRGDDRRDDGGNRRFPDFRGFRGRFPTFFRGMNDRGVSGDRDVFGITNNDDNFVGSRNDRDGNVCTEKRNYRRPVEPDTENRRRTGRSSSCTSTRSTRICSNSYIEDGVEHVEERISRCCPGTVATDRGCVRRSLERASDQIRQINSNIFLDYVRKAQLQQLLDANNTIFVPTDNAFQRYLRTHKSPSDIAALRQLLHGHIVRDNLPLPLVSMRDKKTDTLAGPLLISMGAKGPLVNCQPLISRDQPTPQGGLIHTIGGVLQSQNVSLLSSIQADPRLSQLYGLLEQTGLIDELKLLTSVTLLAPTNDAIAAASLPQDQELVKQILRAHIISGIQCSQGLPGAGLNARGEPVFLFSRGPQQVLVAPRLQRQAAETVRLVSPDVVTRTGLLQPIHKVIIPPFAVPTLDSLSRLEGTKQFARLLSTAGLGPAVNSANVTILIPPPVQLPTISRISDPTALRTTLSSYILQSGLYGGPFPMHIPALSGQQVLLTGRQSKLQSVQCVPILGRLDLGKPSVHVLGVGGLIVPPTQTLLSILQSRKDLSNFAHLVQLAGLEAKLNTAAETLTLLAPDNSALSSVGGVSAAQAAAIVNTHTLQTSLCAGGVRVAQRRFPTLGGGGLFGSVVGANVVFAPAAGTAHVLTVTQKDVVASNGVLHVVDRYIQPTTAAFKA